MNYLEDDVYYYATLNPGISFSLACMTEQPLLKYLEELSSTMQEYQNILVEKSVQYEPLDCIYILNRQVKTLNSKLYSDMVQSSYASVMAAFLCLFNPKKEYLPFLAKSLENFPRSSFIFNFAIDIINNISNTTTQPFLEYIAIIKNILKDMPNDIVKLRELPTDSIEFNQLLIELKEQQKTFREFYHTHSIEESLQRLKFLPRREYIVNYKTWIKEFG